MQDRKMGLCHFSPRSQLLPFDPYKSWAILSSVSHHCISTAHRTSIYDLRRAMSKTDVFLLVPVGTAVRKMPRAFRSDSPSSLRFILFTNFTNRTAMWSPSWNKIKNREENVTVEQVFFWQGCVTDSALETDQNTRGADAQWWLSNTIPQHHLCPWCPLCYSGFSSPAGMAQQNMGTHILLPLLPLRTSPGKQENWWNLSSLPWAEGVTCLGLVGCQKEESIGDGVYWSKYKMELDKNEWQTRVSD